MTLQDQIIRWTMQNSGAESRDYLGMSAIGQCPRRLYTEQVRGKPWNVQGHFYCYLGYLFERDMLARLKSLDPGAIGSPQEFSDFGGRFQGHSDGSWRGDLLEIKSTTTEKLPEGRMRIPKVHYWQVQTYMHYGHFNRAIVIYIARDTGQLRVIEIRRNEQIGELARLKAASILEAVDLGSPPDCECGWCK